MKVAVISANLGGYDNEWPWAEQIVPDGVEVRVVRLNDDNYPIRPLSQKPRLQCGIPKMTAGFTYGRDCQKILWLDGSCSLAEPNQLALWLEKLGDADIALFKHPERSSIEAEVDFMLTRMRRPKETYLTSRYAGENIVGAYNVVKMDASYVDDALYASTAFMYSNNERVRDMMLKWYGLKAAFCLHDQIVLPWLVKRSGCTVSLIEDDYMRSPFITFVRK